MAFHLRKFIPSGILLWYLVEPFSCFDEQSYPIFSMKLLPHRRYCKPVNTWKTEKVLGSCMNDQPIATAWDTIFFNLSVFLISFYRIVKTYYEFHSLVNKHLLSIYRVPGILNLFPIYILSSVVCMMNILYLVEKCTASLVLWWQIEYLLFNWILLVSFIPGKIVMNWHDTEWVAIDMKISVSYKYMNMWVHFLLCISSVNNPSVSVCEYTHRHS